METLIERYDKVIALKKGCVECKRSVWDVRDGLVYISCPTCRNSICLTGHTIDVFGNVMPSVTCTANCGFNDDIRLIGWILGTLSQKT